MRPHAPQLNGPAGPPRTRVRDSERIQARTLHDVSRYIGASDRTLSDRIRELEHEWSIERRFEANGASIALVGLGLGLFVDRRFFVLPVVASSFLLQHALTGWAPPIAALRGLGLRTAAEIQQEILALRILRGDFIEQPTYPESLLATAAHSAR